MLIFWPEIVERVKEDGMNGAPFRPKLPEFADPDLTKVVAVMKSGWNERPTERPSAQQMLKDLQRINPFKYDYRLVFPSF